MVEEVQTLFDNNMWDLEFSPTRKKVIGCYWIFAVKFNPNKSIARLKVGLIAKKVMRKLMQ